MCALCTRPLLGLLKAFLDYRINVRFGSTCSKIILRFLRVKGLMDSKGSVYGEDVHIMLLYITYIGKTSVYLSNDSIPCIQLVLCVRSNFCKFSEVPRHTYSQIFQP